jgi:5-deoxy-5-amino-3-dehydroquinate synthase
VAIGLVFAAELAAELGRIEPARVADHRAVIDAYGLDPSLPPDLDHEELLMLMARDKKALGTLTFVLDGPAGVELVTDVDPAAVRAALRRMEARR